MSSVDEKTTELFRYAWQSDEDLGYPNPVAFVPGDQEWADEAVWRNLTQGRATVVVGERGELLLTPLRRGPFDRLRGRVGVNVAPIVAGRPACFATVSRLGRRPVRQMRELAHV